MGFSNWSDIIREAAARPAGIFALAILVIAVLALVFFRAASEKTKLVIFSLFFVGAALCGLALYSTAHQGGNAVNTFPVIAGTVVDSASNAGLGQAVVTIVETNDRSTTDDNGSFSVHLSGDRVSQGDRINLRIAKAGYKTITWQVNAANEGLVILMNSNQ